MEFLTSTKNRNKLLHGGFVFFKDRTTETGKIYWRCSKYKSLNCKMRLHSFNNEIVSTFSDHNHSADAAEVDKEKAMNATKRKAAVTTDACHVITTNLFCEVPSQVGTKLPKPRSIKRTIQRTRNIHLAVPQTSPQTREEIVLPEKYKSTISGENFVLVDTGSHEDRIIAFGTMNNLKLLAESEKWYADGTFKVTPKLFGQLYTIHILKERTAIPMVFALMPNKSKNSYEALLSSLLLLEPLLKPKTVMIDFESASIGAFKSIFPAVQLEGCYFHFTQALYRKLQCYGFQSPYNSNSDFAKKIKLIAALAFLPISEVETSYDMLRESHLPENMDEFLFSFEEEWIGRVDRRKNKLPGRFPIDLWNVYTRDIRTNNAVEGWHRGFAQLMNSSHPTLWKFCDIILKEQGRNEMFLEQIAAGAEPGPSKKKYRDLDGRIKKIVENFNSMNIFEYLKAISHNLHL